MTCLLRDGKSQEQFKLAVEADKIQFNFAKAGKVTFIRDSAINITGKDFSVVIDPESGIIASCKFSSTRTITEWIWSTPCILAHPN